MKKKKITRKELHNLIWKTPVTHISKEYKITSYQIRKICKVNNIPLPESGHWMKLKFNKKIVTKTLPQPENNSEIDIEDYNFKDSPEISKREKEFKDLKNILPSKLSKPHKYISATKIYNDKIKIRNNTRNWTMKIDTTNVISIDVSDKLLSRALRFMDTFIKIAEKRGYEIFTSDITTTIKIKEQSYNLRFREKNKRIKKNSKTSWPEYDLIPTGYLSLKVETYYPIKEWSDSKTKQIENKLFNILSWLELRAEKDLQSSIETKLRHEQKEKRRKEAKELQRLKDEELLMFSNLMNSATRWHKSQYLKNYIKEFEEYTTQSNSFNAEKEKWIEWAKEKIDWYDPFIEKEIELLKGIDRDTLK